MKSTKQQQITNSIKKDADSFTMIESSEALCCLVAKYREYNKLEGEIDKLKNKLSDMTQQLQQMNLDDAEIKFLKALSADVKEQA